MEALCQQFTNSLVLTPLIEIVNCNGSCGQGKHIAAGRYVCPHNNMAVMNEKLAAEWDYENNKGRPEDYLPTSCKKFFWICQLNPCGCHRWEATANNRHRKGYGCPFCSNQRICLHNSLYWNHPNIAAEWDYQLNKEKPWEVAPRTDKLYWWICGKNPCGCHRWQASPDNRIGRESGCPFCCNRSICLHNSLYAIHPEVAAEWDYSMNPDKPWEVAPSANTSRWWICKENPCGCHRWEAVVNNRTSGAESGCPFCVSKQICIHNSLYEKNRAVSEEWDFERNQDRPWEIAPTSNKPRWWICKKSPCDCHRWEAVVSHRNRGDGCPFCSNKRVCPHNNLQTRFPEIAAEWDHQRNDVKPDEIVPGSRERRWWICRNDSSHKWSSPPYERTINKGSCPSCYSHKGYSRAQIDWIQQIEKNEHITIQHALSPEGEFFIPTVGEVDGYCRETNTVYEYHGDYWHGNPIVFDQDDMNRTVGKTFGELYLKTIKRDQKIRDLGYNLVVRWETPI